MALRAALAGAQADTTMAALSSRLQGVTGEAASPGGQGAALEQGVAGAPSAPGELDAAAVAPPPIAHTAQNPVTVVTFDRMLVEELGLGSGAAHVQATAATAGMHPPSYFGSEVVARFLELRYEHPVGAQRLDLFPGQPITRAEAAWSLYRVMGLSGWSIAAAREALSAFELPQMTAAQRQTLQIAVSRIGYPYVWAGPPTTPPMGSNTVALTARASHGASTRSQGSHGATG